MFYNRKTLEKQFVILLSELKRSYLKIVEYMLSGIFGNKCMYFDLLQSCLCQLNGQLIFLHTDGMSQYYGDKFCNVFD